MTLRYMIEPVKKNCHGLQEKCLEFPVNVQTRIARERPIKNA